MSDYNNIKTSIPDTVISSNYRASLQSYGDAKATRAAAREGAAKEDLQETLTALGNPMNSKALPKKKSKKDRVSSKRSREAEKARKKKGVKAIEKINDALEKQTKKNPELKRQALILLSDRISKLNTKQEIHEEIKKFYTDPYLQDDALELLIEINPDMAETLRTIKTELNDQFEARIVSARNIAEEARAFSDDKLGSPIALRELYFETTHNPKDALTLFNEFASKYNYEDLSKICKFLFNSIGRDLNSGGPSIPRGLLHRLMGETKTVQAILGVYNVFKEDMSLLYKQLAKHSIIEETYTSTIAGNAHANTNRF